jgi:hypothetical protein
MHEYNLRVGNAVISLEFRREEQKLFFSEYFQRPSHPSAGDISLKIRFKDDIAGLAEIPNSLFLTKKGDGEGFSVAGGLIIGRFSAKSGEGELIVQSIIMEGSFARVFEQVLYQAYWSAVRRKGLESLLLHSSGIVRRGKGHVFVGKSGSGKSTVAGLTDGATVLNDEITILDFSGDRIALVDTPFNGFFSEKAEGSAPLSGVLLLRQAPHHRITRIKTAESIKTLSREIIPPMGLETELTQSVYWEMLGFAEKIHERSPVFVLEFLPDPGFWKCIDEIEGED